MARGPANPRASGGATYSTATIAFVASIRIRRALEADSEVLWAVHQASVHELGAAAYTADEIEAWAGTRVPEDFRQAMTIGGETMIVAERLGAIVGFASLCGDEVRAVYVHPTRGRGTGAPLLEALEQIAAARGVARVHLTSSLNAEAFYLARGYAPKRASTVVRGRGVALRVVEMEKVLRA